MPAKLLLEGFLAKDPTYFEKKNGNPGVRFVVPVTRPSDKDKTDWYTVFLSGGHVERAKRAELMKGDLIYVYGRFSPELEERNGRTHQALNVNAVDFEVRRHSPSKRRESGQEESYEEEAGDVPF